MVTIRLITPKSFEKQVEFASANALNTAAFAVRKQQLRALPRHFTIRRNWTARTFRVNPARRRNLIAEVGSTAAYMEDQTIGDTRTSGSVPTSALRRSPRSVVTKRRWPAALLDNPRYFLADRRARRGPWAGRRPGLRAVVRRGTGKRRRQRIVFFIPETQRIKPRFPFRKIAEHHGPLEFNRAFPFQLQRALETAK